jgi:hypothetical protein
MCVTSNQYSGAVSNNQIQCARHVTGISVIYATTLKTHVEQLSTIVGRKMEFHGEVPIEITMLA